MHSAASNVRADSRLARMKLISVPKRPKHNPLISVGLGHDKYQSWKAFLGEGYWSVELK